MKKNYVEKRLLKILWTENEVLMGKDSDQNISAIALTLLYIGVGIVWSNTTRT